LLNSPEHLLPDPPFEDAKLEAQATAQADVGDRLLLDQAVDLALADPQHFGCPLHPDHLDPSRLIAFGHVQFPREGPGHRTHPGHLRLGPPF